MGKVMKNIFLSASIPSPERDEKYYSTADFISIKEAVRALATVVIPQTTLIWGGHPAITPIISDVLESLGTNNQDHVILYQSEFYKQFAPKENLKFKAIKWTKAECDASGKLAKDPSLTEMRKEMLKNNDFCAAFFIGGMEGCEREFEMFKEFHPTTPCFPIASTGAAAKKIYERSPEKFHEDLLNNYAYVNLFNNILKRIK